MFASLKITVLLANWTLIDFEALRAHISPVQRISIRSNTHHTQRRVAWFQMAFVTFVILETKLLSSVPSLRLNIEPKGAPPAFIGNFPGDSFDCIAPIRPVYEESSSTLVHVAEEPVNCCPNHTSPVLLQCRRLLAYSGQRSASSALYAKLARCSGYAGNYPVLELAPRWGFMSYG